MKVGKAICFMQSNLLSTEKTHFYFNKKFGAIDEIAENEANPEFRFVPEGTLYDEKVRKRWILKDVKPIELGRSRDILKKEALVEVSYEMNGDQKMYNQRMSKIIKDDKGAMSTFGYKHRKSHLLYAYLLKCLRCCYDEKFEQLNVELNFFLLLKNELSLHFLRQEENVL
jgi:hypothetical protein